MIPRMRTYGFGALCFMLAATAAAQGWAADGKGTLVCTFKPIGVWTYGDGKFAAQSGADLTLEIGDIDADAQTAHLITERGTGALKVVSALGARHFLEVATEGFLNITTVYERDGKVAAYPAVHSRHLGLLGQPLVAHYHGTCKDKTAP